MLNTLQHMYLASQDSGYLEINWTINVTTNDIIHLCLNEYTSQTYNSYKQWWYANNKEKVRIYSQDYRKKNLNRIRNRDRERARRIAAKKCLCYNLQKG
jgi:hypothetical protein